MRGSAPQYGQQDVDEQVSAAAGDEEDAHGGNCVALVADWRSGVREAEQGRRTEEGDDDEEDRLEHGCGCCC
jgi:hypothetical protein